MRKSLSLHGRNVGEASRSRGTMTFHSHRGFETFDPQNMRQAYALSDKMQPTLPARDVAEHTSFHLKRLQACPRRLTERAVLVPCQRGHLASTGFLIVIWFFSCFTLHDTMLSHHRNALLLRGHEVTRFP